MVARRSLRRSSNVRAAAKPGSRAAEAPPPGTARPETYVVKRGDTLYGIALDHGLDYRDLARWNGIPNPNAIEVGQVLRVRDPEASVAIARPAPELSAGEAVATPYQAAPPVEGKAVTGESSRSAAPGAAQPPLEPGVLTTPKAVKLPYSEAALASLQGASPLARVPQTRRRELARHERAEAGRGGRCRGVVLADAGQGRRQFQ